MWECLWGIYIDSNHVCLFTISLPSVSVRLEDSFGACRCMPTWSTCWLSQSKQIRSSPYIIGYLLLVGTLGSGCALDPHIDMKPDGGNNSQKQEHNWPDNESTLFTHFYIWLIWLIIIAHKITYTIYLGKIWNP